MSMRQNDRLVFGAIIKACCCCQEASAVVIFDWTGTERGP